MKRSYLALALILALTGCASDQVTRTGPVYPARDTAQVQVLLDGVLPTCPSEQLGAIRTAPCWNQTRAIEAARQAAADLGATHVTITEFWFNDLNDAMVAATAYRCR